MVVLTIVGPATALDADFTFPADVGGFARGPKTDYEARAPGLGYSYVYRSADNRWRADVYVYDGGVAGIPDGPDSPAARGQFAQASGDIATLVERGRYRSARDLGAVRVGAGRLRCGSWTIVNGEGKTLDSVLCVTGARGKFVKFRVSGEDGADRRAAERFLTGWDDKL